jgi:hypothetical protein
MVRIETRAHIGSDGALRLDVPTALLETDVDVQLILEPVEPPDTAPVDAAYGAWPPGFFEETYGALADDPLERPLQGDYETREPFR